MNVGDMGEYNERSIIEIIAEYEESILADPKKRDKNWSAYPGANCPGTTTVLSLILLYVSRNV